MLTGIHQSFCGEVVDLIDWYRQLESCCFGVGDGEVGRDSGFFVVVANVSRRADELTSQSVVSAQGEADLPLVNWIGSAEHLPPPKKQSTGKAVARNVMNLVMIRYS